MQTEVRVCGLDWGSEATWPSSAAPTTAPAAQPRRRFDVVIGSDLVYADSVGPLLAKVVDGLLAKGGRFLFVAPAQSDERRRLWCGSSVGAAAAAGGGEAADTARRAGLPTFLLSLQNDWGFRLITAAVAPADYVKNPLASQDATVRIAYPG